MKDKAETGKTTFNSPYLNARREWNERYGDYISAARMWRRAAMVSLGLAVLSVGGVVYFASQNKLIPYVVEISEKGRVLEVYPSDRMLPADERVIRAQLAQFVQDVRGVSYDISVQKRAIERAYFHLSQDYPAYTAVNDWFRGNVPFERARTETVVVDVRQVLPLTENTWRLEWMERPRNRNGEALPEIHMTGTATIIIGGEVTGRTIQMNPIGMYVQEFDWSRNLN